MKPSASFFFFESVFIWGYQQKMCIKPVKQFFDPNPSIPIERRWHDVDEWRKLEEDCINNNTTTKEIDGKISVKKTRIWMLPPSTPYFSLCFRVSKSHKSWSLFQFCGRTHLSVEKFNPNTTTLCLKPVVCFCDDANLRQMASQRQVCQTTTPRSSRAWPWRRPLAIRTRPVTRRTPPPSTTASSITLKKSSNQNERVMAASKWILAQNGN